MVEEPLAAYVMVMEVICSVDVVGVLGGLDDGKVLINKDGTDVAVPYEAISKMKLLFDFSNI